MSEETTLLGLFSAITERALKVPTTRSRGLAGHWTMKFVADSEQYWLHNAGGEFTISTKSPAEEVEVTLTAADSDWKQLFSSNPEPGYQTLYGMLMSGKLRVSGDMILFNRYLFLLELLLGTLPVNEGQRVEPTTPVIEPIIGRYINLTHNRQAHRIYFEEAGQGTPLLCLHTAGADGRQFRALLNDERITGDFRVIVFDMPRHGKSAPPDGFIKEPYLLTTDEYVSLVMTVIDALQLDRPVVMGCSIGGRVVLHLAQRYAERFKAVIGLQSALYADAGGDFDDSAIANTLFRPDINSQELAAASVAGIMSPNSPEKDRWETLWYYMQGGPGVFLGDLYYYFVDGDLRNGLTSGIDTLKCPVYLLTGEYDLSARPDMAEEVAKEINATHFEVMKDLGHFPMSENPELFKQYLMPVLESINDLA